MPIQTNFFALSNAWNPLVDNGFVNASVPSLIGKAPQFVLSGLGLSTWAAQIVWLLAFYWLGSVLVDSAARKLFPILERFFFGAILAGMAYQLAPGLVYTLQDSAAYGLTIGFYWGIPLLVYLTCRFGARPTMIQGAIVGLASLLFLSTVPK